MTLHIVNLFLQASSIRETPSTWAVTLEKNGIDLVFGQSFVEVKSPTQLYLDSIEEVFRRTSQDTHFIVYCCSSTGAYNHLNGVWIVDSLETRLSQLRHTLARQHSTIEFHRLFSHNFHPLAKLAQDALGEIKRLPSGPVHELQIPGLNRTSP